MDGLSADLQSKQLCAELLARVVEESEVDALGLLRVVADLEEQIEDSYTRGHVCLQHGVHALAAGYADDAVEALSRAHTAFKHLGTVPRLVGDSLTQRARAQSAQHDVAAQIISLREALVHFKHWADDERDIGEFGGAAKQIETAVALHRVLIYSGHPDPVAFEDDVDSVDHELWNARPELSAHIDLVRSEGLAARGHYQAAETALTRLAVPDHDTLRADVSSTLGFVLASSGRSPEALPHYIDAARAYNTVVARLEGHRQMRDAPQDIRTVTELISARNDLATCLMNSGAVRGSIGEHDLAIDDLDEALRQLKRVPFGGVSVARCALNKAAEFIEGGALEGAATVLTAVEPTLRDLPPLNVLHAEFFEISGRLLGTQQQHLAAAEHHYLARTAFSDAGRPEWAARAGINIAVSTVRARERGEETGFEPIVELIPALLYLDQLRFQFPTVAGRSAWRHTVAGATRLAFEVADGDASLVSELIEHVINSGTHSATPVQTSIDKSLELRERIGAVGEPMTGSIEPAASERASGSGVNRLVAGSILPMHPPPRLSMPGGSSRIVLGDYFALAESMYGGTAFHSSAVVAAYD